jgi:ferredoxin-NADP reductase
MSTVTKAQVIRIINHGDDVKRYDFRVDKLDTFEAGQFLQLTLDDFNGSGNWPESRAFSIASSFNNENVITIIIKKVGTYTDRIFNELKKGGFCTLKYAYGDFLLPMFDDEARIHCIAGGTGISPFLSFFKQRKIEQNTNNMYLYYSVKKNENFAALDEVENCLKNSNINLYCTQEIIEGIKNSRIDFQDILFNIENIEKDYFYICGSNELINNYKILLQNQGALNIITEDWS